MAVVFHEPAETPHLDVHVGTVVIGGTKCPGLEMSSVTVGIEFGTPLKVVAGECRSGDENLELTWKLTPLTLKSYPQTSHPGAFSISSASKEDSPLMPKSAGEVVDQNGDCKKGSGAQQSRGQTLLSGKCDLPNEYITHFSFFWMCSRPQTHFPPSPMVPTRAVLCGHWNPGMKKSPIREIRGVSAGLQV